jgi:hypothetical protein
MRSCKQSVLCCVLHFFSLQTTVCFEAYGHCHHYTLRYLVDLPGYGYAKASKDTVLNWNSFTRQYFLERDTLVAVLLLVDASIPPMPLDVACAAWFSEGQVRGCGVRVGEGWEEWRNPVHAPHAVLIGRSPGCLCHVCGGAP